MAPKGLDTSARGEWRRGWPVVLAGAVGIALAAAPPYTTGIMIRPLEQEFGWTRAQISSGPLIPSVFAVFAGPFIGMAVDRFGPRRIGIAGAISACTAMALLSTATQSIWSWWLLWSFAALAGTLIKPLIWTAAVSSLFKSGRGLALAATLCGTAICSTITPVLANHLIEHHGWRMAYLALAAFWAVVVIPPVVFLFNSATDRHRTRDMSAPGSEAAMPVLSGVTAREGLTSWRYVRLAGASVAMVLATVAYTVNLVPILVSTGQPRAAAAAVAGLIGISTVIGRLSGGYLLDRINGNLVAAISIATPVLATLLLLNLPGSLPAAIAATAILGLSLGAELDAVAYLTTRHFGLKSFGILFGTIGGLQALATGMGPMLVNLSYDITRSYNLALWLSIPTCLLGTALFLSLGRYPEFEPAEAGRPDPAAEAAVATPL